MLRNRFDNGSLNLNKPFLLGIIILNLPIIDMLGFISWLVMVFFFMEFKKQFNVKVMTCLLGCFLKLVILITVRNTGLIK